MNFFNSVFSDDPLPNDSPSSFSNIELDNPASGSPETPAWNFGGFINTITTRSETIIGVYRRDLQEFRSGLLNESALVCDIATRALKDFPSSVDKLGSSVRKGTSSVLARGEELHLFDDDDGDGSNRRQSSEGSLNGKKYCWFDARMSEIQGDLTTFTEEPDDLEDYNKWKSGFVLNERFDEVENLMAEKLLVERSYLELVPFIVDKASFWCRYFYKVNKLKQAEEARTMILRRAMSGEDEEDLTWDVDEDDHNEVRASTASESASSQSSGEINSDASENNVKVSGEKNDSCDSCKDSDLSIVSRPLSVREEEEIEWDEIDDVGSSDDNKVRTVSSSSLSDLRKRLYAADEDEDLSWDIEDDDEPIQQ